MEEEQEQEQESHDEIKVPKSELFYNEQIKLEEIYNLKVSMKFIKILSIISISFCIIFTFFQMFQDYQFSSLQKQLYNLKIEIEELKYNRNIMNENKNIIDIKEEPDKEKKNDKINEYYMDDNNNTRIEFTAETIDLKNKFNKEIIFLKQCMNEIKFKKFEKCETPKISIVIPVYKTERYIRRLMQSIQNQKMDEIEIIVVENNLGKKNLPKLEEISKIDQRIKIVRNENHKGLLNSYIIGISNVKSKYMIFLEEEGMLLPYLKDIYDNITIYNKDINDFSCLKGSINGITFDYKIKNSEKKQPEISESYYNENFINDNPLLNKIFNTEAIKDAISRINDFYLAAKFDLHVDSLLYICICSYAKTYKSFGDFYSEYHLENKFEKTKENIEALFNSTLILSQFIYDLDYEFEEIFNQRCQLVINLFSWPLNYNIKMNIDVQKAIEVVNRFLTNRHINEINKRKLDMVIRKIKDRKIHKK